MAYNIGGKNIEDLAEVHPTSDIRNPSGLTTSALLTFGGKTFKDAYDKKFIINGTAYMYANDINAGKYKSAGFFALAARGTRPRASYAGRRWDSSTANTYYVNKFTDGEVWVSTTFNSRSGTRIGTAAENLQYVFTLLIGPGGGGGGSSGTVSGGGGGGGSFAFLCHKLVAGWVYRIYIGSGGSGGSGNSNGTGGGNCQAAMFTDINNLGTSGVTTVNATGGGAGRSGGNDGTAGGGGTVSSYDSNNSYITRLDERTGTSGGSKNNGGGSTSAYQTQGYSPENSRLDYGQGAGGAGNYGGGGGGGWYYGHNGGKGGAAYEAGGGGGIGSGGGGGAWVLFSSRDGGNGGNGYAAIFY